MKFIRQMIYEYTDIHCIHTHTHIYTNDIWYNLFAFSRKQFSINTIYNNNIIIILVDIDTNHVVSRIKMTCVHIATFFFFCIIHSQMAHLTSMDAIIELLNMGLGKIVTFPAKNPQQVGKYNSHTHD